MKSITVLFPIYNEGSWLKNEFRNSWSFLNELKADELSRIHFRFCLWEQNSPENLANAKIQFELMMRDFPRDLSWNLEMGTGGSPSVVASLQLGFIDNIPSKFALLCPIDCALTYNSLLQALHFAESNSTCQWAIFKKTYTHTNLSLNISVFFQNHFIVPFLKINCWTNLFLIPTTLFSSCFQKSVFLEDLAANKALRKTIGSPIVLTSPINVSSRRYLKRGSFAQIKANILIYFRYVFFPKQEAALKELHDGGCNAQKGFIQS
jgi:hypothetical protein